MVDPAAHEGEQLGEGLVERDRIPSANSRQAIRPRLVRPGRVGERHLARPHSTWTPTSTPGQPTSV